MKVDYYIGPRGSESEMCGIERYLTSVLPHLSGKTDPKFIGFKALQKIPITIQEYALYPIKIRKERRKDSVSCFISQDTAYLLNLLSFNRSVVICYDLIHYLRPEYSFIIKNKIKISIAGMKRADRIITISNHVKKQIAEYLNYPEERIDVAYPGVDFEKFKPFTPSSNFLEKYGIGNIDPNIILYVGSEHPRMNLNTLIKALYFVKKKCPDIKFLKVGRPQFQGAREKFLALIKSLGLERNVIFIDYVEEEHLPAIYNAASLLVYPVLEAGFGLPPLEAMACGTPVITSNTASLPEVVGDAGIMVNPYDTDKLSEMILKVLTDNSLQKKLSEKGLNRARQFTWENTAKTIFKTFEKLREIHNI